jgi:SAM-dependent methyltransferase
MVRLEYDPVTYDSKYVDLQCYQENQAVMEAITLTLYGPILDLGCGTGLGYALTRPRKYLGVDISPGMVRMARRKFGKHFIVKDMKESLRGIKDHSTDIIALWSINYGPASTVTTIAAKARRAVIVHYNKPYLPGSRSYYTGQQELFEKTHPQKERQLIMTALTTAGFKNKQLLGQEYYYISTKETP